MPQVRSSSSLVLSFSSSVDHRALHSFPTRRSSDLRNRVRRHLALHVERAPPPDFAVLELARPWVELPLGGVSEHRRSEEHTSELQSRPHLVCRLLLEKNRK